MRRNGEKPGQVEMVAHHYDCGTLRRRGVREAVDRLYFYLEAKLSLARTNSMTSGVT
jgi:hypothetical protein